MPNGLVIACNNASDLEALRRAFSNLNGFEILGEAHSGSETICLMQNTDATVLLSDLFFPDCDGITLFEKIHGQQGRGRVKIFGMSTLTDDRLLQLFSDHIIYCFSKPFQPELVTLRISEMLRAMDVTDPPEPTALEIVDRKISEYLLTLGVPVHLKGYYYLRDAIRMYVLAESPVDLSITVHIYPEIAKLHNTRPTLVEHAMRNAIEIAWVRGNLDTIIEFFGYTVNDHKGKPSNLEFVAMISERLRMNCAASGRRH